MSEKTIEQLVVELGNTAHSYGLTRTNVDGKMDTAFAAYLAARAALLSRISELQKDAERQWVRVEDELPAAERSVLAFFVNDYDKGRVIRAYHAPRRTIAADYWDDDYGMEPDTDENGDGWVPEGWYEFNEYDDKAFFVGAEITHWMPLPKHPCIDAARSPDSVEAQK